MNTPEPPPPAPVTLRDGCLVCKQCDALMTPCGDIGKTLVGYWSPPGHDHDNNCRIQFYECPNGHRRKISKRQRCPKCDWVGKDSCFCHPDLKVDEWPAKPTP